MSYADWRDVEVPYLMRALPKDHRGYPIPVVVLIDRDGKSHFAVNDHAKSHSCMLMRLCHICGGPLRKGRYYFVGGPLSAGHGQYMDGPMHEQCGRYALRVCPYLAAPRYSQRIDYGTLDKAYLQWTFKDPLHTDERPEKFGFGRADRYTLVQMGINFRYQVKLPWLGLEWWKDGERIED